CERRNIDTQKIYSYLLKNNFNIVNDPKEADYIILMTCGYIKNISDLSLHLIREFNSYNAELIVAGCLPDINKEELTNMFDGRILPINNLDTIEDIFYGENISFRDLEDEHLQWQNVNTRSHIGIIQEYFLKNPVVFEIGYFFINNMVKKILGRNFYKTYPVNRLIPENSKYNIMISRGCIHNCTYCSIKKAIGPLKSKPIDLIITELKKGLTADYKNIVLEADDIGPYGIDIKSNLPYLLDRMTTIEANYTLELKNTHPHWVIKYINEFEEILKRKKIKSILLSVQSGNNRILNLMGRVYSKEQLIDTILRLKKAYSGLEIGVHLMVGFPSEKYDEFCETMQLFDIASFDFGDIFPYSCQDNTKANLIEPKISEKEIKQRMNEILTFLRRKNYFAWSFMNKTGISFYKR
ncbi:MAG: radical SAM protein, partial [Candidatus Thermoplasmatota archaeon]|nr:radical SAM protein [Candidatus Thermoplasmatota archaeon]